jgi:polysaccharide pyruvyl transferase WcaK-like protein
MDSLRRNLTQAIPRYKLRSIPNHWIVDASSGLKNYVDQGKPLSQPAAVWPDIADHFECVAEEWLCGRGGPGANDYLATMQGADLVLFNGEGNLYRTNVSAIRGLYLCWLAKSKLGLPAIFLNGTVHLTDVVPILPAIVRKTFAALDAVIVREPYSVRNLQEYAPGVPVQMVPDAVFGLPRELADASRVMRAFGPALADRGYFCFGPGAMPLDYRYPSRSALFRLITELKQLGLQAVLVAKDFTDEFLEDVAKDTDSIYFGPHYDYRDLMAVLANARFQVTGRYHILILGAIVGCPSIALAGTTFKNHGLCEMLEGQMAGPFDSTDLWSCLDAIKQQAAEYVAADGSARQRLQARAARLAAQSFELGSTARAVLGRRG